MLSMRTNQCITKAIKILNMLVSGHFIFRTADPFMAIVIFYMAWPWNMSINENVQPPVDCEMAKYSAIFFVDESEFNIDFFAITTIKHRFSMH